MWNRNPFECRGTLGSTIQKFLNDSTPDIKIAVMYKGRLLSGIEDKSRTHSGVAYNRLFRLWRRTHKKFFRQL